MVGLKCGEIDGGLDFGWDLEWVWEEIKVHHKSPGKEEVTLQCLLGNGKILLSSPSFRYCTTVWIQHQIIIFLSHGAKCHLVCWLEHVQKLIWHENTFDSGKQSA